MALSFGPFFTCFIVTLFLTVYLHIIMHHTSVFHKRTIQFSLIGILVILIRMSIPFNFPFTYSFQSYQVLPRILDFYNTKYCWLPSTGGYADIFNLVYGRFYPAVAAPGSVYTAAPCALCIFLLKKKAHMHICTSFYRNTLPNRYGLPLSRSQSLRPSLDYYIRF